ncbi:hypothetical protein LCGC14_1461920 [marine sediment metagenome]|uniref:Uncharacterized protein n=1 Tax=marine sediment metagenome TaxID=412755 RepID=A0A0F9MGW8_9ZZZZ
MVRAITTQTLTGIEIEAPYNARFVSAIKALPEQHREWQPDRECTNSDHHGCSGRWVINTLAKAAALLILRDFYSEVEENTIGRGTVIHRWRQ